MSRVLQQKGIRLRRELGYPLQENRLLHRPSLQSTWGGHPFQSPPRSPALQLYTPGTDHIELDDSSCCSSDRTVGVRRAVQIAAVVA
jgi:hypothetical protein